MHLSKRLLFNFGKVESSLCSFCKTIDRTHIHLSCEYHIINYGTNLDHLLKFSYILKKTFSNQLPPTFSHLLGANKQKKKIRNYIQHHNFHIAELKSVWTLLSIKLKAFVFSETIVTQKKSMPRFVTV